MPFTAINASRPVENVRGADERAAPNRPSTRAAARNDAGAKSIASAYLGRGEADLQAPITQALHGAGAKKASGQGKKRASAASRNPAEKRRKTSDGSAGMDVRKPAPRRAKEDVNYVPVAESSHEEQVTKAEPELRQDRNQNGHQPHKFRVYAPSTSMDSFTGSTQSQTSVEMTKPNRSQTLYRRTQTPRLVQSGVTFAEPLLRNQVAAADGATPSSGQTASRPVRGICSAQANHQGASFSQKHQQAERRCNPNGTSEIGVPAPYHAPVKPISSNVRSLMPEENFIDDEDMDENELSALMACTREVEQTHHNGPRERKETQLRSPAQSDASCGNNQRNVRQQTPLLGPDEDYLVSEDESHDASSELYEAFEETTRHKSVTPPARDRKLNMREVAKNEDYGGALFNEEDRQGLAALKSSTPQDGILPIVRLPFPKSVLDRSPIFGVSNTALLRTCFRIGEALKEGAQAVRWKKDLVLEIFARVTSSWRELHPGRKQQFVLKDLYHENAPHLEGSYELWQQSPLWDSESKRFLEAIVGGVMCRVIAKMKRVDGQWKLEVLNIWEAGWEDVDYAAGIYAKEYGFPKD